MEPKKNRKADLNKNSNLYFVIGLCAILFITWRSIEWKTYDPSGLELIYQLGRSILSIGNLVCRIQRLRLLPKPQLSS